MIAPAMPAMVAPMTLDTHWLTYAELADKLAITGESARNLVRRRGWPRKPGNDGAQRIGVPAEYLDERAADEVVVPPIEVAVVVPIVPPVEVDTEGTTMAALEAHIATLKGVVDHERHRADVERQRAETEKGRADTMVSDLAQLRERAEQEQSKARALREELGQARERVEQETGKALFLISELTEARAEMRDKVAQLQAMLDEMRRPSVAPSWLRWINAARAGRQA